MLAINIPYIINIISRPTIKLEKLKS